MYAIDALSQAAANLSLANTMFAEFAAHRSDIPSPTNTVTAPTPFRQSIALGLQVAVPLTQLSAFDALPALMAILVAPLRILDYWAHSYLLFHSFAFVFVMAKDDEVAFCFQLFAVSSHCLSGAVIETKWPTR